MKYAVQRERAGTFVVTIGNLTAEQAAALLQAYAALQKKEQK